jgi:hypothetical protein
MSLLGFYADAHRGEPTGSRCNRHRSPRAFEYLHTDCFRLERFAGWSLHSPESAAFARRTPGTEHSTRAAAPANNEVGSASRHRTSRFYRAR